jgi:phage baseplate assembly protein V
VSAELERMLANLVRIGRVAEVDTANARVKLQIGGLTTDWLPWGVGRAGTTRTWSAPTVGEQRVILSPYGDMTQAVVGAAIYQDDHAAPASSGDQEHVVFPDGSSVDFNSATNTLTVNVAGAGNVIVNCKHATVNATEDATTNTKTATVNASTKVELATPLVHCTQALTVEGVLTYKGGLVGSGGGTTATINGNMNVNGNIGLNGNMTASGAVTDGNGDGGA